MATSCDHETTPSRDRCPGARLLPWLRRPAWLAWALLFAWPAPAQVVYLQNDSYSGGAFNCNLSIGTDASLAAKFTAGPSQYPYSIDHVRVLGCGGGPASFDPYFVDLYQDDGGTATPGTLLWQSANPYLISGDNVFNDISFGGEPTPPPLIASGSIRVVLVNFSVGTPIVGFGTDTNGISAHRNYVRSAAGAWSFAEDLGVTGDWVLRLAIVPPVPVELQSFTIE